MRFDDMIDLCESSLDEGLFSSAAAAALGASLAVGSPMANADRISPAKSAKPSSPVERSAVEIAKSILKSKNSELDKLVMALAMKESSCDPFAKGDLGKKFPAYGLLQIRQPMIDDYVRISGRSMSIEDVYPKSKKKNDVARAVDNSIEVCKTYLRNYGGKKERVGVKELAGMWNGGPKGGLPDDELTNRMRDSGDEGVADKIIGYRNDIAAKSSGIRPAALQKELSN